jgi:hypothetical protein
VWNYLVNGKKLHILVSYSSGNPFTLVVAHTPTPKKENANE